MNKKHKTNWWIDLVMFTAFIFTFFMDLTGMELHQWIGVFIGVLAAYHLLAHHDWAAAITKRFFTKAPGRARIYYILDGFLLAGFSLVVLTGLIISTWLKLPLGKYSAWLNVHITTSIFTLVTLLLKLILHWRWIANVSRNIFSRPAAAPTGNIPVHPARVRSGQVGRREFLKVFGIAGAASVLALRSASKALAETLTHSEEIASAGSTDTTGSVSDTEMPSTTETTAVDGTSVTETAQPTQGTAQTSTEGVVQSNDSSASPSNCTVRCHKGCSYPGRCHKYTDSNNNGKCDLGECM